MVADVLIKGGVQGALTVGLTVVEAKVGSAPLRNRKSLTVHNNGNKTIYWGYDSSVTPSTGTPIEGGTAAAYSVSHICKIYLIADNTGIDVRITEGR